MEDINKVEGINEDINKVYSKITILYSSKNNSTNNSSYDSIYSSHLPKVDNYTYEDVCINFCGNFLIVEVLDSEEQDYITCHPFELSRVQSYRLYD